MKDYYKILEVEPDASDEDIKKSYYKLAFKYHPDRSDFNQSEELFTAIVEAYDILSNPVKRLDYDNMRRGKSNGLALKSNDPRDRYREPFGGMQDKPEKNKPKTKKPIDLEPIESLPYQKLVTYSVWLGLVFTALLFMDFVIPNRTVNENISSLVEGETIGLDAEDVLVTAKGSRLIVSNKVSDAVKTAQSVVVEKSMIFARNKNINLGEWPYQTPIRDTKMYPLLAIMVLLAGITLLGIQKNISSRVQVCCGIGSGLLSLIGLVIVLL